MRRIIMIAGMLFICFVSTVQSASENNENPLCKAVIARLLSPHIQEEINNYYKPILKNPPTYAPFYGTEIRCDRASTNETKYSVTATVSPYVGAHISIGVDEITFSVGLNGDVQTISYKHIENHKLPPHLENLYR